MYYWIFPPLIGRGIQGWPVNVIASTVVVILNYYPTASAIHLPLCNLGFPRDG